MSNTECSDSFHRYPSIYALGHRALANLFLDPVLVEEKIDGSQVSWCWDYFGTDDPELRVRSKGAQINLVAPEKMFVKALDIIRELPAHVGWTYRAEYLSRAKHNALAYDRIPKNHLIIFDINTGNEEYLSYDAKMYEADRIGLEVVPYIYRGMITDPQMIRGMLDRTSILGGQKVEGVVVKNYCVTPHHKTLTSGLDWVSIGDLDVGDKLIAPTEYGAGPGKPRYYRESVVEVADRVVANVLEVEFSDGTVLYCTTNHPILVHPSGKPEQVWRQACDLRGNETVCRFLPTWEEDKSYAAGYIAGILDGEGHMIHRQPSLRIVAETSLEYLDQLGFRMKYSEPGSSSADKFYLLGGKTAAMKLMGTTKPKRFLDNFIISKLGGMKSRYTEQLKIASIRPAGRREVVQLQTSSSTYFTDGFASHNSRFGIDKKALMGKFVSEAFKEVHDKAWKANNPKSGDIIDTIIAALRTPARWNKAVQHLRDAGMLESSPRDIGPLMREVHADIDKECLDLIGDKLLDWAVPKVKRGVAAGLAEWWKEELLKKQFEEE